MPNPGKLVWPIMPKSIREDADLLKYFTEMQESTETYLRTIQTDLREFASGDLGSQDRWSTEDEVYYDSDGNLHFHVGGVEICWFDWDGNWHRAVNFDNLTTNLTKTNTRQLVAFDKNTGTIDIFHNGAQVLQFANDEVIIDNQFAVLTGQTLDAVTSTSWIDEANDVNGNLTTFISVKETRVLEIEGTDVKIKGAFKLF